MEQGGRGIEDRGPTYEAEDWEPKKINTFPKERLISLQESIII